MNEKVTLHMIVRNEAMFVKYSLMSVAPYVARTLVYIDARSNDDTEKIVGRVQQNDPTIEVSKMLMDERCFGKWRDMQIRETKTPFFMMMDGDHVVTRANLRNILRWTNDGALPEDRCIVRTGQYIWFYGDRFHVCDCKGGGMAPLYRMAWRGLSAHCLPKVWGDERCTYGDLPWNEKFVLTDPEIAVYHYSWIQKPERTGYRKNRIVTNIRRFTGPQPEVFRND